MLMWLHTYIITTILVIHIFYFSYNRRTIQQYVIFCFYFDVCYNELTILYCIQPVYGVVNQFIIYTLTACNNTLYKFNVSVMRNVSGIWYRKTLIILLYYDTCH